MNPLEEQVAATMRGRAAVMEVPPSPVDRLIADGEAARTRARRRPVLLVAAAVLVTLVALSPLLLGRDREDRSPEPAPSPTPANTLDGLRVGPPLSGPYLQGGALHLGEASVPTSANRLLFHGDTLLVGRTSGSSAHWWRLNVTALVRVPQLDGIDDPHLSPLGDLVVWTSFPDARTTRVDTWVPATGADRGHVDLDAPYAACCGGGQEIEVLGIDADDLVYWTSRTGPAVWEPGTAAPRPVHGVVASLSPRGPVFQGDPGLPTDQGLTWSDDGGTVAYAGDARGSVRLKETPTDLWAMSVPSGRRTHLDVPRGARAFPIVVDQDGDLLVDAFADPQRHYVLRCHLSDGSCERTLPPGPAGTWIFPEP